MIWKRYRVLIKMLKNGNYDIEAHWLSILWGRSRTRRMGL